MVPRRGAERRRRSSMHMRPFAIGLCLALLPLAALAQAAPSPAPSQAPPANPLGAPLGPNDPCTTLSAIVTRPTVTNSVCTVRPSHVLVETGYQNTTAPGGANTVTYPQALVRIGTYVPGARDRRCPAAGPAQWRRARHDGHRRRPQIRLRLNAEIQHRRPGVFHVPERLGKRLGRSKSGHLRAQRGVRVQLRPVAGRRRELRFARDRRPQVRVLFPIARRERRAARRE
jgi:hypothetical protein